MDWVSVGARVRKHREFLGFTREELAEKLEITPKFCSDIELGLKGMSVPTLCKLASTLHLSTDYILFGTEKPTQDSPAVMLLQQCPSDKQCHLEDIIKAFIFAVEN